MKYVGNYKELVPLDADSFKLELLGVPPREIAYCDILEFEPGKIIYTHTDQFLCNAINPVKYIMFLTDWDIGHIFTYNDEMLSDYKIGDLYQYSDDNTVIYSWANIGYTTSKVLEITLSDGEIL